VPEHDGERHDAPPAGWTPLAAVAASDEPSAPPIPETRGRRRATTQQSKAKRERAVIAALRALPPEHRGWRVEKIAADVLGMSRYQASVIVTNLHEAGALERTMSRETTPRGGRPPALYRLDPSYRARLDADDAREQALFGTVRPRAAVGAFVAGRR